MSAGSYSTPHGLFGVTSTIARVRSSMRPAAVSGSGCKAESVSRSRASTPAMSSHILWLK